ncbi:hypothetical protein NSK11_contig00319-0002, partial [Nocardia seriolae]
MRIPVIDHWWQTETGWPVAADLIGLEPMPTKAGSATVPVSGFDVRVLAADGTECAAGEEGSGQVPHALVVLKSGADLPADRLTADVVAAVRDRIGPIAALR